MVMPADERAQMRAGTVDWLVAWEQGALSAEGEIHLFQELVNSGLAWQLQGMYGRQATAMLDAGLITSPFQVVADSNNTQEAKHED